ncbi:MAG: cellulase family glycosylhydrolase [Bacteroidia bacterium]|nr:cellulase family glycosylhydrolase [Bacteroidia bacterium]NND24778.1 cellulase family glycosylhydrolase [Flavobacteriaceae bacterium]NNL33836.1 cellulase family glycosylhydrolase [Flavobacteriaceae bacterium]
MVNINKNILRSFLLLSYVAILALIIFGISSLYSYLNLGADRNTMLHTEIKKIDQYIPRLDWAPLSNEGRKIDEQTLSTIENDYLDAWYVKHVAYKTNNTEGIDDYYTENARRNIIDFVALNLSSTITIDGTTLEHHPKLEFFSEDGQLAVITDKDVIEYKRIYQNEKLVLETKERNTYKSILLLEDGFWRIRHMIKEQSDDYEMNIVPSLHQITTLQGINYYPQATPWDMFGDTFSKEIISKDFEIIKNAGLNSVRVFVQYDDFGKANINEVKLEKLKQTLDSAEEHNLKVLVTLFDFYGDYSVLNWTLNMHHAETIVSTLKDHKAIVAWDIKNEPNLDFESRGKENVIAWLDNMIDLVKSIDKKNPVTIGWSNTQSATILKDKVDFISFHYYEDLETLETSIKTLKTETLHKPLVMQEFGRSSYNGFWSPFGSSDEDQADFHKKAQEIIAANDLQFMSWTLYDFENIPKEVVGRLPWRKNAQKQFGFINNNGAKKASFKYISKQ